MSVPFAFNITIIWMLVLFVALLVNHFRGQRDLFVSSVFALSVYIATHLSQSLWLRALPIEELLGTHYLFYAGMAAFLAVGLFWINKDRLRVMMTITIVLLGVEALLGYAIHLDRNVLALNGALIPNSSGASAWWLWNLQSAVSQVTNLTVLLAVTLPKIYQVKTDDNTVAFDILEDVERYLEKFKETSIMRLKAQAYLYYSAQGLCETTGSEADFHHYEVGTMLLNEGIKKCCYEPGRTQPVGYLGRFVYWLRS